MTPIRVVIVDANDLIRHGIVQMIQRGDGRITIMGAYATLPQMRDALRMDPVDILLLDDTLPTVRKVGDLILELKDQHPHLSIVVTSDRLSGLYVQRLLESGATGFIYKVDRLQGLLVPALEMIRNGSLYVSPKAAALTYMMRRQTSLRLTETDRDVLWLISEGHNIQEIAAIAELTTRSVYRIREKLRKILNVKTNEQIVDAARKRGLLDISNQA